MDEGMQKEAWRRVDGWSEQRVWASVAGGKRAWRRVDGWRDAWRSKYRWMKGYRRRHGGVKMVTLRGVAKGRKMEGYIEGGMMKGCRG